MDWLALLAVNGILKSVLQHHSSKASILRHSAFFTVQLAHPYMTTGKTITLIRQTFVGKVMSLLSNMLSRLVIAFLPRSRRFLISWLQSPSAVILEPKKIKSDTVSTVSPFISHEVMGPDAMTLVFWMSLDKKEIIKTRAEICWHGYPLPSSTSTLGTWPGGGKWGSVLPGPCPCTLGCLRLAWPFCPHSASCALGWPTMLDAELRLRVRLQPRFLWWELQGDFMERMNLDSYQITLLLTVGRLEFQTQEVQRQFTDTHCWPES